MGILDEYAGMRFNVQLHDGTLVINQILNLHGGTNHLTTSAIMIKLATL